MAAGGTIVVTAVGSPGARDRAALMIASLRAFGGALARARVLLFEADPVKAPCGGLAEAGVDVVPLPREPFADYPLAAKVSACACAESLAPPGIATLVWFNHDVLVIRPPDRLVLDGAFDAAVRPVHIRNVGIPAAGPLDGYWRGICEAVGIPDIASTVESFVDGQRIRAYFNTHAFSVAPSLGLFGRWRACFEALVADRAFQAGACADAAHRIFLHQAVLSALIAAAIAPARLRALAPGYAYPYNLHADVPEARRPKALQDLVCVAYEGRPLDPRVVDDIEVGEPLRSWLSARAGRRPAAS